MQTQISHSRFFRYEPYFHLLFWAVVLLFPYIKYLGKEGGYPNSIFHELNALFFHMALSYFVYFFVLRTQIRWRVLIMAAVAIMLAYVHEYFDSFFHDEAFRNFTWKQILSHLITYASFGVVFYALHISKEVYRKQQQLLLLYEEKQMANIAALKAQVTPHFLFNTLNSIYQKVLKSDAESAGLILRLSDNVRYFLGEGQDEKIALEREIEHIENYIQLQKERWKKKVQVSFSLEGTYDGVEVVPLLFIPFVENAFKYASRLRGNGHFINICFSCENGKLTFSCANPYSRNRASGLEDKYKSGIGVQNVRKRLQLAYPDTHELKITDDDQAFMVNLILIL